MKMRKSKDRIAAGIVSIFIILLIMVTHDMRLSAFIMLPMWIQGFFQFVREYRKDNLSRKLMLRTIKYVAIILTVPTILTVLVMQFRGL